MNCMTNLTKVKGRAWHCEKASMTSTQGFSWRMPAGFSHAKINDGTETLAEPREGTLICSYIRRLGPSFGVQNFEFQYFWGFSEK